MLSMSKSNDPNTERPRSVSRRPSDGAQPDGLPLFRLRRQEVYPIVLVALVAEAARAFFARESVGWESLVGFLALLALVGVFFVLVNRRR